MGRDKFPGPGEINWNKIREVRVSQSKTDKSFSFEFDLHGRNQKMTVSISPDSTAYTISRMDGVPIAHATQHGNEIDILDFEEKFKPSKKKLKNQREFF
jgi:hypothetical protein